MTTNLQLDDQFPDVTIRAGTPVKFELLESSHGLTARNIQSKFLP